jgi:hypothetical protein
MTLRADLRDRAWVENPGWESSHGEVRVVLDWTRRWHGSAEGLGLPQGLLEGTLFGLDAAEACCDVAIVEAGRVVASGPIHRDSVGRLRFSALLPPALHDPRGRDRLSLYRVDDRGALHRLSVAGGVRSPHQQEGIR